MNDNFGDAGSGLKTRHQAILAALAISGAFGPAFDQNKMRFTDEKLYNRKKIGAISGSQIIVDATTQLVDGISSFDAGKVPAGIVMAITGIQLKVAIDSTKALAVDNAKFSNFDADLDAAILNSEIEISVNGKLLPRVQICDLVAAGDTTTNNAIGRNHIYWMGNGIPAKTGDQVKINLIGPAAGVLADNWYFVEIGLCGPGFREK